MLSTSKKLTRRRIVNTEITNEPCEVVLQTLLELGRQRQSAYVCLTNTHMVVEAYRDAGFNDVVNNAVIATPDGKPIAVAMNWLYKTRQAQIAGYDLMLGLLQKASDSGLSVFFWVRPKRRCNALKTV